MERRGAIMIVSLGIVAFLSIVGTTCLIRSINEGTLEQRSAARHQAFCLAEAAVDQAAMNLRTPPANPNDPNDPGWLDDVNTLTLPAGRFQIDTVSPLGNNQWQATVRGLSGSEQRRAEVVFQLTPVSIFQYALFGDTTVGVQGSAITDSYDSRNGLYGGANIAHHGDVGTNTTIVGQVQMQGNNYFIDGQVWVGPNVANPQTILSDYRAAQITAGGLSDQYDVMSRLYVFPMPPVAVPQGLPCNDVTVNGGSTVTLASPGVYCYHDLTLGGGATFDSTGPVTIYITGQLRSVGNSQSNPTTIGVTTSPQNMMFLMSPSSTAQLEEGTLGGTTGFYGTIYGPQADVRIFGHADIFGSVVARTVDIQGNAQIHYDTALGALTTNTIANLYRQQIVSWREL